MSYKLYHQETLANGEVRNLISYGYFHYDVRTLLVMTLDEILDMVFNKYGVELYLLDIGYVRELF